MTATWPEAVSRLSRAIGLANNSRVVLSGTGGYVPEEALILTDGFSMTNTNVAPNETAYKAGLLGTRSGLAAATANIAAEVNAALGEMALSLGYSGLTGVAALSQIYTALATNTPSIWGNLPNGVETRGITRGTPSYGGTNVGNGTLTRLQVDQYGYPLEADEPEPVTLQVTLDANTGTLPGQEQFSAQTTYPAGDVFQWWTAGYGDGLNAAGGALVGVTGDTTASLIQNPSFSSGSGSGSSFALTNWVQATGSPLALSLDTVNYYRACALEGSTPASLAVTFAGATTTVAAGSNGVNVNTFVGAQTLNVASTTGFPTSGAITVNTGSGYVTITYTGVGGTTFTGCTCAGAGVLATGGYVGQNVTETITQTLAANGTTINKLVAYFSRLACNVSLGSAVATFTVTIGSKSWSVFGATQSGWFPLSPPLSSANDAANGMNLWVKNFNINNFTVSISVTIGKGVGRIDDFLWAPFTNLAGKLLWAAGGSTNWLSNDTISFTDSEPQGPIQGVINHWIARLFPGWSFPAVSRPAAPVTAPVIASTGGGGGALAGLYYFAVSYVNSPGSFGFLGVPTESPLSPVSLPIELDGSTAVTLTIPTGPSGTSARFIYMTAANGNQLTQYFLDHVDDNTTTTYVVTGNATGGFSSAIQDPT